MDASVGIVFMQLPPLLVIGAAAATLVWWQHEGALSRLVGIRLSSGLRVLCVLALVGVWLGLTLVSWWCLFFWAYLTVLAAYVLFGVVASWAALIGAGAVILSVPFVWGMVLFALARREFHYASTRPPVPAFPRVRALHG